MSVYEQSTGKQIVVISGSSGGSATTEIVGTTGNVATVLAASTPAAATDLALVVSVSPNSVVRTKPASLTLVPLDIATVTTGGTAVTALAAGNRTAGGWIQNPVGAATNLGINEIGTASGTTSAGSTTFVEPGQSYLLTASANAVSVISSDSAHPFSGMGFQ